ncbi:hypothetical protein JXA32_15070 [Candidatus Sumerlaeota bacterium]|nr:hypothetical protein [Candidatus Sumerlaeota bacterium]
MINILGVHSVEAPEPCCLIEVELNPPYLDYDWGGITQEDPGQSKDNWQVPWDERPLDAMGGRWAFFFHYLDCSRPLLTPDGPMTLPISSPVPEHLAEIEYEEP